MNDKDLEEGACSLLDIDYCHENLGKIKHILS
jgi:hypothetical protein